jgi:ATP/maltotriose-dependent transcriptional regulator MalT
MDCRFAAGSSVAAWAQRSLNTVKTHTKNNNSKLDVNNRTKAIARAKEIGLL